MRRVERINGLSCVVHTEVPQGVIDLVEDKFPGMGGEVTVRPYLPLDHSLADIAGSFNHVGFVVNGVELDIFLTLREAQEALPDQLKKYQGLILGSMPAVVIPTAHIMNEVRGMVENMFGLRGDLACHFVWRAVKDIDGWFETGYKFMYGGVNFEKGNTVEEAVAVVRAVYREWLGLRISGDLKGGNTATLHRA